MRGKAALVASLVALSAVALIGLAVFRHAPLLEDSLPASPGADAGAPTPAAGKETIIESAPVALGRLSPSLEAEIDRSPLEARELLKVYGARANEEPAIGLKLAVRLSPCWSEHTPEHQLEMLDAGAPVERVERSIEAEKFCAGLTESDLLTVLNLLEIAAQRGTQLNGMSADVLYLQSGAMIVGSPLLYQNLEASSRYRGNALAFLNAGVAQGSAESMYWLSAVYEEGRLTARDPLTALRLHDAYVQARGRETALDRERRRQLQQAANTKGKE